MWACRREALRRWHAGTAIPHACCGGDPSPPGLAGVLGGFRFQAVRICTQEEEWLPGDRTWGVAPWPAGGTCAGQLPPARLHGLHDLPDFRTTGSRSGFEEAELPGEELDLPTEDDALSVGSSDVLEVVSSEELEGFSAGESSEEGWGWGPAGLPREGRRRPPSEEGGASPGLSGDSEGLSEDIEELLSEDSGPELEVLLARL
ncbi:uncharacterized protein AAES06_001592 isoform 1-T1 [Glossophaga mutica]